MPKIAHYISRLSHDRHYDDQELQKLQNVYDRGRLILDIDATDPRREKLALLIFACADQTNDVEALLANVIKRFDREK